MIYGASGYTGLLLAERAAEQGQKPVLAGRDALKLRPIAGRLGLPFRAFPLDDAHAVREGVAGMGLVLHCAGPFSATSRPMLDACLAERAHYLDITGEIDVFEACYARDDEAKARGVVVMPGVGFDVVPTDCLAALLAARLPGATRLELGIAAEVTFCGHLAQHHVWEQFEWADVLLHTGVIAASGDRDGLPNVIPEAMSCGVVVVTSPTAGTTEAITDGVSGFVVPVEATAQWVAVLRRLSSDDAVAEQVRSQARRWVEENFDAHRNAARLLEAFEKVVAEKSA